MANARGITLSTAPKIARRVDLSVSTAVKQWRAIPQSIHCKKNRDLSIAVKSRWSTNKCLSILHSKNNPFSTNSAIDFGEVAYTVDVADLLSTPERDFLLKSNGEKVPISSLRGKLVGLYFCENITKPPHMQAIKKVYEEAKSRDYDFEIVQITLHYHRLNAKDFGTECYEDISWLAVPFMDPSCRKIQLIFECIDTKYKYWVGDCLVLIYPCQAEADDNSGVLFEFEGGDILYRWGIEGYPFTRPSLYKAEYEMQKREFTLQSLFPAGECLLRPRSTGDGFDLVDALSQLSGKRVLVFFARHDEDSVYVGNFIAMLKCEYEAQEDNVAEESRFEVVYVTTGYDASCFDEFTKDMPWLVRDFPSESRWDPLCKVFKKHARKSCAAAFNEQGELIANEVFFGEEREGDKFLFPSFDQDLEKRIPGEVEAILHTSTRYNKNYDLSTVVKQWRGGDASTAVEQWRVKGLPFSKKGRYDPRDIGYTVDVADLLFTAERDFLVKNNGQKIKINDLKGKTIVLFIVPLDVYYDDETWYEVNGDWDVKMPGEGDALDMIDAYSELLRVGSDVEFVFVPLQIFNSEGIMSPEALFNHLFSTMPFPAVPFTDVQGPDGPVVHTFSVDQIYPYDDIRKLPYWVVIDPTNTVVATRYFHPRLFKLFGGAELHPLSRERISALEAAYKSESRVQRISKWDQLLASHTRDFLLSSNGDKVPISSLKGKLVGLYFCENIPHPPRMQAIKKVYEEAKSRGYDFEIVQITFHYYPSNAEHIGTNSTVQQCREDVNWLTLPFKDPSCRKVQRILKCADRRGDANWDGDCLVLVYPRQDEDEDSSGVLFEFAGAEILTQWGIEGYPFTRPSLYKAEYEIQKRDVKLQSFFPPGECLLQPAEDGFNLVDATSQLSGKKVLVLFIRHSEGRCVRGVKFLSMLKSKYKAQVEDNVAEENKFEVVYVSTSGTKSSFEEFTKDMPWLVRTFSSDRDILYKFFSKGAIEPAAAAFNEQGELIAKEDDLFVKKEADKLRFPFIDHDWEKRIRGQVDEKMSCYYYVSDTDSDIDC